MTYLNLKESVKLMQWSYVCLQLTLVQLITCLFSLHQRATRQVGKNENSMKKMLFRNILLFILNVFHPLNPCNKLHLVVIYKIWHRTDVDDFDFHKTMKHCTDGKLFTLPFAVLVNTQEWKGMVIINNKTSSNYCYLSVANSQYIINIDLI